MKESGVSSHAAAKEPAALSLQVGSGLLAAAIRVIVALVLCVPLLFALLHPFMYTDVEYELVRATPGNTDAEHTWIDDALTGDNTAENRALLAEGYSVEGMPKLVDSSGSEALPALGELNFQFNSAIIPRQPFTALGVTGGSGFVLSMAADESFQCSSWLGESTGSYGISSGQEAVSQIAAAGISESALNDVAHRALEGAQSPRGLLEVHCLTAHVDALSARQERYSEGFEGTPFSVPNSDEFMVVMLDQEARAQLSAGDDTHCYLYIPRLNVIASGTLRAAS